MEVLDQIHLNEPENQEIIDFQHLFTENIDKKQFKKVFDHTCNAIQDKLIKNLESHEQDILVIIRYF